MDGTPAERTPSLRPFASQPVHAAIRPARARQGGIDRGSWQKTQVGADDLQARLPPPRFEDHLFPPPRIAVLAVSLQIVPGGRTATASTGLRVHLGVLFGQTVSLPG